MFRDVQFGLRLLAKSPVFTATAVLLLAIGISANTLIFSLVDALLLRPLPVPHPENLVRLVEQHPTGFLTWDLPYDLCGALASEDASISEALCQGEAEVALSDGHSTERVGVHLVSPNFFSSLGARAYLGRLLGAEDERTAAHNAVLSYEFWKRRFQRDPSILGKTIVLRGHPFTVVGVSAEGFNGLSAETSPDIRVPAAVDRLIVTPYSGFGPSARPLFGQIFGRLRTGVPLERANAEVDSMLHPSLDEEHTRVFPTEPREQGALRTHLQLESVSHGVSTLRAQFSRGLDVLMAGVALLLLLACANVGGLIAARSSVRTQEISVRLALGASPARIVRQLLNEGLVLALLGGAAGALLARTCLPLITRSLPPIRDRAAVLQPLSVQVHMNGQVLSFTMLITLLTAVLFALSPALRCAITDLASTLRGTRNSTRRTLPRNFIVVTQVALCTLILTGAVLLLRTLQRLQAMNPGFDSGHIVTFTIDPALRGYTDRQSRMLSQALLAKTGALPGIVARSIAGRALMRGTGIKGTFAPAGMQIQPSDFLNSSLNLITPGYFDTMGMHLLAGRDFTWFDRHRPGLNRVVVNQTFARHFFSGRNPIGKRFGFPGPDGIAKGDNEIIGVVSDAKYRSLREPIQPTVYTAVVDGFDEPFVLHLRTPQRPEAMIAPVREVLRSLDPELPLIEVLTLRQEVHATLWQERLLAMLATIFGAVAALLASIGLYGALDYSVKSRTREIGVRMALGAQPGSIIGLLSRETALVIGIGFILGLGAYAVAANWIAHLLYGTSRWEPIAVVSVLLFLLAMSAIAAAPAAYRAVRIDPATALRSE